MKSIYDSVNLSSLCEKIFHKLWKVVFSDTKILVAVSGWPDSMLVSVLMYNFFVKYNYDLKNLFFVHCNHKTRPETDTEETFICDFFKWLNLEVRVYNGNEKTENSLRVWRYAEFNNIIKNNKIDYLITWHNLTDRIESTFMNMCRGSGLNGFLSMKFLDKNNLIENAGIIRPILDISKQRIEEYCKTLSIPYVVDSTNFDQETSLRNKIRLSLLPQFMDISYKNDWYSCSFFESMNEIYEEVENLSNIQYIWNFIEIKKSYYWNADFAFLREIPTGFIDEKILLEVFKKFNCYLDVTKSTVNDFLQFFSSSGQWFKYMNWVYFFVSNWKIYIIKAKQNFWEKNIEKELIIDRLWECEIWKNIVNIDSMEFVWKTLRYPKSWDNYGSKSWSKYCINKKIPVFWRNFIPVIVEWDNILKYFY